MGAEWFHRALWLLPDVKDTNPYKIGKLPISHARMRASTFYRGWCRGVLHFLDCYFPINPLMGIRLPGSVFRYLAFPECVFPGMRFSEFVSRSAFARIRFLETGVPGIRLASSLFRIVRFTGNIAAHFSIA